MKLTDDSESEYISRIHSHNLAIIFAKIKTRQLLSSDVALH